MLQSLTVPTQLPITYLHTPAESATPKLVLFLHGYTDSAKSLLKRAWPERASDYNVLAPNAPFPVPVKTDEGYKAAFSWYFIDDSKATSQERVVISPAICIEMLVYLIKNLGYENHEKVIIGFSQGGFLAARLASHLQNVKRIIGIGTGYQSVDYQKIKPIPVDAIHGDQDAIIRIEKAKQGLDSLQSLHFSTQFFTIRGLGHTMNDEARALLKERVRLAFV